MSARPEGAGVLRNHALILTMKAMREICLRGLRWMPVLK